MIKGEKQRRNERAISILAENIRKYRMEKNLTIEALANTILSTRTSRSYLT
jgi:hypothetical protein